MQVSGEHVEEALRELADADAQARLWLADSGPEVSSLDECACRLFNDSGLGDALDKGPVYGRDIDAGLRELRHAVARIDRTRPVPVLLADPAVARVRKAAQTLLVLFNEDRYRQ
jgi:hypothetical protein